MMAELDYLATSRLPDDIESASKGDASKRAEVFGEVADSAEALAGTAADIPDVLAEVRTAVDSGRMELELLGQTVNAYRCPKSGRDFGALLGAVASIDGVVRLRFTTSHPAEVNDSMIAAMRDHTNISRHLHLPVQSGSSRVLRRMKRLYTREKYLETIARIRQAIPENEGSAHGLGDEGNGDRGFHGLVGIAVAEWMLV